MSLILVIALAALAVLATLGNAVAGWLHLRALRRGWARYEAALKAQRPPGRGLFR